jgi:hypothetical protein
MRADTTIILSKLGNLSSNINHFYHHIITDKIAFLLHIEMDAFLFIERAAVTHLGKGIWSPLSPAAQFVQEIREILDT